MKMALRPKTRLRVAYLCDQSPHDTNLYSGGNARIYNAVQKHVGDVHVLSNSWHLAEPIRRLVEALPEALNLRLRWRLHLLLAPIIAMGVRRELKRADCDVLLGVYSYQSMFRLRPPKGMLSVFTSDATPTVYKRSAVGQAFGSYFKLSRLIDPLILRTEKSVMQKADLLVWPSAWQDRAAQALYGLTRAKSHCIPWGANIERPAPLVAKAAPASKGPVQLLFIGRDWFAKGGHVAFHTMEALKARGIKAELTVIGCTPPVEFQGDSVKVHASLNKAIPAECATFEAALRSADFLVQASYASYGFAFCEAAAYGLPALCLNVGGIPMREGINGHALQPDAMPEDFADVIDAYVNDAPAYAALRQAARAEYEDRLNWDAWGQSVSALIHDRLNAASVRVTPVQDFIRQPVRNIQPVMPRQMAKKSATTARLSPTGTSD